MPLYDQKIDWYYEGNISQAIVTFLRLHNYKITKDNSSKISERGEDIVASKDGITLIVEVKGYPTEFHTKGENKRQRKRTNPKLQAKHWFSEGIFTLMKSYSKYRNMKIEIALGLPKHERYDELLELVKPFFIGHGIRLKVIFVDDHNIVTEESISG
jgi:Holliday junction resolvase-like predicted endonuclease